VITVNSLPATPAITASGPTTFCAGDSITLISSAGTSYLWSTGATTPRISVTTAGSYTVKLINENGCQSPVSPGTSVTVNALPLVSITGSSTTCMDAVVTLTGNPAGGTFFVIDGPGTISGNILTPTETGNINVEYLYTGVCSNTAKYSVLVGDKPVAFAGSDQLLKYVFNTILEGVLSGTETGEWSFVSGSGKISDLHSPTSAISDLSVGENILLWTVKNGNCESVDEVIITVEDLFIPSVITPNGDNKNDFFIVTDIGKRVELTIINRWGAVEYTNSNYLNDWDGRNMKGNELPADTYFYILKYENGITRKGTVLITR
jgi:gliding motility-associated-like protein